MPKIYTELQKNSGFMSIKAGDPLKKFVPRMEYRQTHYMD